MTRHQKLQLEQSENRKRLGELLDVEARSDEQTVGTGDAGRQAGPCTGGRDSGRYPRGWSRAPRRGR